MAGLSNAAAVSLLNYYFRGQAMPTPPASAFIALFNGDPENGGTEVTTQVRAGGRVAGTFSAPTTSNRQVTNTADIDFGASVGQATITHIAVYDSQAGGTMIIPKAISAQRQVAQGDPVKYPSGNLTFRA